VPASLDERYGSVVVNLAPHDLDRPTAEEIVQDVFVHLLVHMQIHWGVIQEWLKVARPLRGGVDGLDADRRRSYPAWRNYSTSCASTVIEHSAQTVCSSSTERPPVRPQTPLAARRAAPVDGADLPMYRRGVNVACPMVRALTDAAMTPDKAFGSMLDLFHRRTLVGWGSIRVRCK